MQKVNYFKIKYPAYSLVELLVIMVVFVILAAMGISSLTSFRDGARFRSATLEFESTVEEIQNLARNNVVSRANAVDPTSLDPNATFEIQIAGYYMEFENKTYNTPADAHDAQPVRLYSCRDGNFDSTIDVGEIKCSTEESWLLFNRSNFRDMDIKITPAGCRGIFFKNASTDLKVIDTTNIISSPIEKTLLKPDIDNPGKTCTITLQLRNEANRIINYSFTEEGNEFSRTSAP